MLVTLVLWCFSVNGFTQGQFSGKNIALGKPATQYPGSLCYDNFCYDASLAVDGKIDDPDKWQGHCSHTLQQFVTNAYWMINFTDSYYITGVVVYNRIYDVSVARRLRGFKLFGVNTGQNSERLLYTYEYNFLNSTYPSKIEIPLPDKPYVSGIRIEIPYRGSSEPTLLALCEVEVYSDDVICPPLTLNNNTIASYTNNRYNGSIASFSCVEGYDLQYTENLLCHNEKWIGQTPECQLVYCPSPLDIKNGVYDILSTCPLNGTHFSFICSIKPRCHTGYNLTQGGIRYCSSKKQWSGPDPICQLVKCFLPYVQHGSYVFSNGSAMTESHAGYGAQIHVVCDIGYYFNRSITSMVCQQDGTWNDTATICIPVTCDHPGKDSLLHGIYIDQSGNPYLTGAMNYLETIRVNCSTGYRSNSKLITRVCQHHGFWSGFNAECTIIVCQAPEITDDVRYEFTNNNTAQVFLFGTTVNISCNNGMYCDHCHNI